MPAVRLDGAVLALCAAALLLAVVALRLRATLWRERRQHLETARKLDDTWHLEELAAELSRVTTAREAVHAGLTELLHWLHCAAGAVVLATGDTSSLGTDGGSLTIAHAIGYGGDVPLRAAMSPHAAAMITRAMREQDTLFADAQPTPAGAPPDLLHGCASAVIIPLTLGHRASGAVVLCFDTAREFDDPERHTLDAAGRLIAQALARASGYDRAEHARAEGEAFRIQAAAELRERQKAEDALVESEARYRLLATRTTRLYAFSAGLSEAITTQDVAKVIVRHGNVVAGASAGSVVLLADDGTHFETLHSEGYAPNVIEPSQRFAREPGLCTTAAANTRAAVYVSSFADWQRRFPRSATLAADGGFASTAALPLLAKGAVMGVLSFHFTAPVNFGDEYRALLESVSQHCAQALDRARLYEATERARADAEAANRSKDEFLSTVSHELRTPLNAMLGWASMLRNGALDERRAARALEAIYTNATRQAHLIEELLDVSRIVAGRASIDLHEFDLAEHLRGVVEAIMPMAEGKGLELRLEPVPSILVVADPRRLEQVFLNLLTNAVKFTRTGGHITVAADATDASVDVRVSDNGDGIDPAFLPHVFERFRQGDSTRTRRVGGLGLGLFIARHLVEAQGGSIRVQSDGPGRGSTFTVTLPAASAAEQPPPPPPHDNAGANHDAPQPPLHGVRVLIVDDEPDAREMMAAALEVRGAMVASASSAREALDLLTGSAFDVLLSDIAMPGQDGYALIESVRGSANARVARIPAAAVTACTSDDERERALATGFQSYVTKPVQPADLTQTVAALAGGAAPLSPFSAASL